jgi:hypothetical protein
LLYEWIFVVKQFQLLGLAPSFGFGDRTGLATPGHVEAMKRAGAGISPIFAQQSIREMARTGRTPKGVVADAIAGMQAAGWSGASGADADHLKTTEDIDATLAAGFTFFTLDPSPHVDATAANLSLSELESRFALIAAEVEWALVDADTQVSLPNGSALRLSREDCLRAAVKYGRAVNHACELADHLKASCEKLGREHEVELSVDETDHPTTLAEHFIVAKRCLARGMKLVSLAPRFLGDFEKGVDFKGDVAAFEASVADHAAIAEMLGPYKLSLHSGSDKISVYTAFARLTRGKFHVKTAGTSYLEALRVIARVDPPFFRDIVSRARLRYNEDKATYHVSATLASARAPAEIPLEGQLEAEYLENWADVAPGKGFTRPGRQILHCTFGSILTDPLMSVMLKHELKRNAELYREVLAEHFGRHLEALQAGMAAI